MTARSLATSTMFAVTLLSAPTWADAPGTLPEERDRYRRFVSCSGAVGGAEPEANQLAQCLRFLEARDHLSLTAAESLVARAFAQLSAEPGAPLLALRHGVECVRNADLAPRTRMRARARSVCAEIIRTSIQLVPWIRVEGPCVAKIIVNGDEQLVTASPPNRWTPATPGPVTLQVSCPDAGVNSMRVTLVGGRRYTIATTIRRVD